MDLSYNNLLGGISLSLENLKMLHLCHFSFNKLLGAVPKGGIFKILVPWNSWEILISMDLG